jgi:hypothetical protein
MTRCQRSSKEWFAEAARCYIDWHQGCAWCGESHCVYRSQRYHQHEYCCSVCDFRTTHNLASNHYASYAGEEPASRHVTADDI